MRSSFRSILARSILVIFALFVLGACSSRAAGPSTGGGDIRLIVENSLPGAGALTIYAIPEIGGRRLVGHVSAGRTVTLSFPAPNATSFRFLAEDLAGAQMVSNILTLSPGLTATWNLSSNVAYVSGE